MCHVGPVGDPGADPGPLHEMSVGHLRGTSDPASEEGLYLTCQTCNSDDYVGWDVSVERLNALAAEHRRSAST